MFCDLFWCEVTRDGAAMIYAALIGLLGGILAVIGAIIIGRRQLTLLDYQASLQAEIGFRADSREAQKIRADLWDKRFAIYNATAAYVGETLVAGHPPGHGDDFGSPERQEKLAKITQDFLIGIETSKLLFSSGVHDDLERIRKAANDMHYHWSMMDAPNVDRQTHVERHTHWMKQFAVVRDNLANVFGPDLEIGDRTGHPGRLTDDLHEA